jgi:A/G-specific adenine glycosylase
MDSRRVTAIRRRLLDWYAVEARDLPWRNTRDPYAILVSEVMLQQTRVETVLGYYEAFLEQFPSFASLASAPMDDVLKAWEGLGYYRRAHNLHRTANVIVREHGGELPSSTEALEGLPGIGPYTAGAVASIAFNLDAPVLDGNVIRVLSRVQAIGGDPDREATRKKLRDLAALLLPRSEASPFNQALMDLGARICRPRTPRCDECPLGALCDAHHTGRETEFPEKRKKRPIPNVTGVAGIIWSKAPFAEGAKLLIAKRKADDMLGGLWEFPGGRVEEGETHEEALVRELQEELAIEVDVLGPFTKVEHAYTHFRVTLHFYHCHHTGGSPTAIECDEWTWARVEDLDRYAFPTADRKVLTALAAPPSR